jgi:hypothetical protein
MPRRAAHAPHTHRVNALQLGATLKRCARRRHVAAARRGKQLLVRHEGRSADTLEAQSLRAAPCAHQRSARRARLLRACPAGLRRRVAQARRSAPRGARCPPGAAPRASAGARTARLRLAGSRAPVSTATATWRRREGGARASEPAQTWDAWRQPRVAAARGRAAPRVRRVAGRARAATDAGAATTDAATDARAASPGQTARHALPAFSV